MGVPIIITVLWGLYLYWVPLYYFGKVPGALGRMDHGTNFENYSSVKIQALPGPEMPETYLHMNRGREMTIASHSYRG